ncbi:MAG: right-handed parallel beta-helix repeat-containing protein, partial [Nanoarchaeota archaeon]
MNNNNITLDCNGSIFRGANAETGIDLNKFNGTVIKNCIFENYSRGVVRPDGGSFQNLLLYNNSFANMTTTAINISDITNVTLRTNNFTNISVVAVFGVNITNFNISYNRFCQNNRQLENISGGVRIDNNTLCVTQISPANNTDHVDRNFTFNIPTLGLARTCDLSIGVTGGSFSGRTIVGALIQDDVNVTVNRTFFNGDAVIWQVNCTDTNNNTGNSILFNTTYRGCAVPGNPEVTFPSNINVTFCPGRFEVNLSPDSFAFRIQNTNDSIISCNNTRIVGNASGDIFRILDDANRVRIQHCYGENFSSAIRTPTASTSRNFTIINNTFTNMSLESILLEAVGFNITNNTLSNSTTSGITLVNRGNHTIRNNTITNSANTAIGVGVRNSSNNTIVANNLSFNNVSGIFIFSARSEAQVPSTQPQFENLIANNTICGSGQEGILLWNVFVPESANLFVNNTFCNSSTGFTNANISRVMWSVEMRVVNATNLSVVDANINVTDAQNRTFLTNLLSNTSGHVLRNITEYVVNNSGIFVNHSSVAFV